MAVYNHHRTYQRVLDVRDWTDLADDVVNGEPNGDFWPIVGGRRSGKTWALRGLLQTLGDECCTFVDLSKDGIEADRLSPNHILLLDEPGRLLAEPQGGKNLVLKLAALRRKEVRCVAALTPREWQELREADETGQRVNPKDLRHGLRPLTAVQARLQARTEEAKLLLNRLQADYPRWCCNPYLLEMVFQVAEEYALWSDPGKVIRTALATCEGYQVRYLRYVYLDGLCAEQRGILRDVAAGRGVTYKDPLHLLAECGMVVEEGGQRRIGDPVIARELVPLRFHHLSDLHFGAAAAQTVSQAEKGEHAERMAHVAGQGTVRDEYLKHVQDLAAQGRAPHGVIVSGDLGQWGQREEFEQARSWLKRLEPSLGKHPSFGADTQRLMLVGGNHDVDWKLSRDSGPSGKRHQPFADVFTDWPRPPLEDPPEKRTCAPIVYESFAQVEFYLLGSSELGGEVEPEPELRQLAEKLRCQAVEEKDREHARELQERVRRIDPGLVAKEDLDRLPGPPTAICETLRIAVLHHPLSPLPYTHIDRYAGLINAGAVKDRLLAGRFALALHGHMHMGWFGEERWPGQHDNWVLRIAAAPTLSSEETQERHGFNEIEILPDLVESDGDSQGDLCRLVEVVVRRIVHKGTGWQVDGKMGPFRPGQWNKKPREPSRSGKRNRPGWCSGSRPG